MRRAARHQQNIGRRQDEAGGVSGQPAEIRRQRFRNARDHELLRQAREAVHACGLGDPEAGPFSERYVFPDAAPLHLSRVVAALERATIPVDHVEGFAGDYAETLRHWAMRLDEHIDALVHSLGATAIAMRP